MTDNMIFQSSAMLDSDFIAIVVVKNGGICWANRAMHRIFGYAPGELLGRPSSDLFPDRESYERFGAAAHAAIKESQLYSGTVQQRRKDGSSGWYRFSLSNLKGSSDLYIAAVADQTASYKNQRLLEASEARFRKVVEDQTEVISRFLPDGTFIFVNDVYCKIFGRPREMLEGHSWHPIAHPDDLAMVNRRLQEMSPENPLVVIENRVVVAGGEVRWMQFVNRGLYDAQGTLLEIQSVGRDITQLKETESRLRESEERLELALSGSGIASWDWDIQSGSFSCDQRVQVILGHASKRFRRLDALLRLIDPSEKGKFESELNEHLRGKVAVFEVEHRFLHKGGHWVNLEIRGKVLGRDNDGKPLRMAGTILDTTNRNRLNSEGINLLRKIEQLIKTASGVAAPKHRNADLPSSLTRRQRQIMSMVAHGMTSAEIGKKLFLSTATVISHRRNLMTKLNLHSTAEVTKFAIEHALLDPQEVLE